jgi:hypothetical protein
MKTWKKLACVGFACATVAGSVFACGPMGDGPGPAGRGGMSIREDHEAIHAAYFEARLKVLHDQLGLRAEQESAWQTFTTQLNEQGKQMLALVKKHHEGDAPKTAPERVEQMASHAQDHVQQAKLMADAVKTFYANLDDAQKAKFDQKFNLMAPKAPMNRGDRRPGKEMPAPEARR